MQYIHPDLETLLSIINKIDASTQPKWGKMNAQRMIEHLTDSIFMSMGQGNHTLLIPTDKIEKSQTILASDKPMPKEFSVPFAPEEYTLRNEELELAVDEFVDAWLAYEEYYEEQPEKLNLHPFYGDLNKGQWDRMHSKHFTHHFQQFGLID